MAIKRIIPCLDVDKGRVVKGKKFQDLTDVDDPTRLARFYCDEGADELVFYDITASNENRSIFLDLVENIANEINIPFTVGGGIRDISDFASVLKAGADKVSINSAALKNPNIISEAASKFGSSAIVLSMDAKKKENGKWAVYSGGGRIDTGLDAIEWAVRGERLGAGELVINSIDADGVKNGYDLELTKRIAESVNIPVIASGGAGKMEDFLDAIQEGKADAVLAASVFHYREIKISGLKQYLYENGVEIGRNK